MYKCNFAGRRASGTAGWWLPAVLALGWSVASSPLPAACLQSEDTAIRDLQTMVDKDAARALQLVNTRLRDLEHAQKPDAQLQASLYAVQAQAYSILELGDEAKIAAAAGLKFATRATDPVHLDLLSAYAENVYDPAGIDAAIKSIDGARAAQRPASLADTCLLITRGLLQYRQDRSDLAIASLTQAYRASTAPEFAAPRIIAAAVLSTVMGSTGDYAQALALNQEVIDWDGRQGATLSKQSDDTQGMAFADLLSCTARIELHQLDRAELECNSAWHAFDIAHAADEVKEAHGLLARIDLARGHPEKALNTLNEVLNQSGADLLPGRVASLYQWRARANASLRNYRDAYADLAEYARRYAAANDADRIKAAAALRARFDTDREIERNALLKRELAASREQSHRQARELRWNAIAAALGALVITLLIYFLVVNRRYRQQLVQLANRDALTGLPNRRRTAEVAMTALAGATVTKCELMIAIIDMDHFKIINDRCGHATGDFVLKEFARLSREALRDTDVLGRWGGEEFLLIMPGTTLECALACLERLRTLVFGIRLPPSGAGLRVSLSAGLATSRVDGRSLDEMIARADSALYAAKNDGRDLVRVAGAGRATRHQ